ncbi:hypothetical protein DTO006G1_5111 [Penicillium roqueforti]|nr:hypothetical protein CBS147337_5546 [Penicillium roqueforti]KAI2703316.1 hypothetical protein CBS147372_3631 [Penicillium roqueforti]KAI2722936.1 hypothetical protein CBS147354_5422 [Penicillium roqueforti]KAI2760143.1 hypothetical protein DTO006G1_5111 [Penicillium roqueforti]KAI2771504.1 hypothetical protein DTO012A8_3790 [Penicillium roqueforti]
MPRKASYSSQKSMSSAPVSSYPMGTHLSPGSSSSSLDSSPTSEFPTPISPSSDLLKDPSLLLKQVYQDAKECLRLEQKDEFWALLAKTEQQHGQISLPLPKVPIGKMTRKEVKVAFRLTPNPTDQAPWMHPPPGAPLPQCALEIGRADYTLWYGETRAMSEKAINLVIVEAKKKGMVSAGEAQLLGYMGIVHQERKTLRKVNTVVYGMASDGDEFHFHQINNDSEWTTVSHRALGRNYGKVVDLLTYIMQEVISLPPFVSKDVSAEDDPMTDVGIILV